MTGFRDNFRQLNWEKVLNRHCKKLKFPNGTQLCGSFTYHHIGLLMDLVSRLPGQGVLFPNGGVGVLLADGSYGSRGREHGGSAVFGQDAEERPRVWRPHGFALRT